MLKLFTKHPHSLGESYLKHWCEAFFLSFRMGFTAIAMMIHAFLPFLFTSTAYKTVMFFHARFERRFASLKKEKEEAQSKANEPETVQVD